MKGYSSSYQKIITEAQNNIQSLTIAIKKLNAASGSYGTSKIQQTIEQMRLRSSDNQQIVDHGKKRLSWISTL